MFNYNFIPRTAIGSGVCKRLRIARFNAAAGQQNCTVCPAGFASPGGSSGCGCCDPGQFSAVSGAGIRTLCPPGTISNLTGLTACARCYLFISAESAVQRVQSAQLDGTALVIYALRRLRCRVCMRRRLLQSRLRRHVVPSVLAARVVGLLQLQRGVRVRCGLSKRDAIALPTRHIQWRRSSSMRTGVQLGDLVLQPHCRARRLGAMSHCSYCPVGSMSPSVASVRAVWQRHQSVS